MARNTVLVLFVLLGISSAASAALYQFTLTGEATQSDFPNVNVGDPVVIRYVADSQDLNSDPGQGSYRATKATFIFPNTTVDSNVMGSVGVVLNDTDGNDLVQYFSFSPNQSLSAVGIRFPAGTLTSDALPVDLQLHNASSAGFIHAILGATVSGGIATYQAEEVPEPAAGLARVFTLVALLRRLR